MRSQSRYKKRIRKYSRKLSSRHSSRHSRKLSRKRRRSRNSRRHSRRHRKRRRSRNRHFGTPFFLLGGLAALGTGTAAYLSKHKRKPYVYEEDRLVDKLKTEVSAPVPAPAPAPVVSLPVTPLLPKVSFRDAPLDNFEVRASNWTQKKKVKVPATDTMYTTSDVKLLKSNSMITADIIHTKKSLLPQFKSQSNSQIPNIILFNIQLPRRKKEFYSIVIYFDLKPETANNPDFKNAMELLNKYTKEYTNSLFLGEKGRLKGIGAITNTTGMGLGILAYALPRVNYKGVLLKDTITVFKETGIFEVDIDVSKFDIPVVSMERITTFYNYLKQAVFELGFVIQGQTPDELPEALLGAVEIKDLDFNNAIQV